MSNKEQQLILQEQIKLLIEIYKAAKQVVPTSNFCPLKAPLDNYQWFLDTTPLEINQRVKN